MNRDTQRGATLIELVIAIVIITAASGTIVGLLATMSRNSANVMVQSQSASIANAYLNEIMARSFTDADGPDAARTNAESVDDYLTCLPDTIVRDRYGNVIAGLANYRVAVAISQQAWSGLPAADAKLIEVTVTNLTDPIGEATRLAAFKTRHP